MSTIKGSSIINRIQSKLISQLITQSKECPFRNCSASTEYSKQLEWSSHLQTVDQIQRQVGSGATFLNKQARQAVPARVIENNSTKCGPQKHGATRGEEHL